MKNQTVVVMAPQDVSAMRAAMKEMEKGYYDAKVAALRFLLDEMRETGKMYTAAELAFKSGLSVGEVAAQLGSNYCHAANEAGTAYNIRLGSTYKCRTYVELMEDGSINPDSTVIVRRIVTTYGAKKK